MGHVIGGRTYASIDAARPGDLVVWSDHRGRAVGILLEGETDERHPLLGALEFSFEMPRIVRIQGDTACMNFGNGWIIEPIDSDGAHPSYFEVSRRAGLLVFTPEGWFVSLVTLPPNSIGQFGWEWVNLSDLSIKQGLERGAIFDEWKLWHSTEERDHSRGVPLIHYKAKPFAVQR